MKVAGAPYGSNQFLKPPAGPARGALAALGTASAFAVIYFLAARLGLNLLSASSGVAVFWPGAGIAFGVLVLLGRGACPSLVVGVVVGTIAANLVSDRTFFASLCKGLCNAGEAVLAAWLLERWFGLPFRFGDLHRVAGFLAAAVLAPAASAIGGAAIMTQLHIAAPYWDIWCTWFLAGVIGIVAVAPLVIGLGEVWRAPPSRGEWIEGVAALAVFTLIAMYVETCPTGSWLSFSPGILLLPPLLWLAARCRPTFPIAAAFVGSILAICAITYGMGRFGDAAIPILERVRGVQATVVTSTIFILGLTALFAQRKEAEARYRALYEDNPSMYFTVDPAGTVLSVNQFGAQALGYNAAEMIGQTVLKVIHEEDREAAQQQLALCARDPSTTVKGEIRKVRRDGSVLWVRETSRAVHAPDGRTLILIVCEDTTERKQAEALLKESKTRLSDALAAGLVVAFEWDARTGRSQRSDNADRIMGFAEGGRFLQQVHPEDRENFRAHMRGLSPDNPSYALTFRFVRPDGRQAWLEETAKGEFDSAGRLLRINGLTRDITERKELEDHKNTLIAELDHRVKNVLATVLTVASRTQETSGSMAEFVVALEGRIKSMATTHELLSYRRWQGIPLAELVHHELAPYATTSNARIDGPDVVLSAEAGQTLAMVFHELATNAAKFGALSVRSGRVSVRWNFRRNGHAESWLRIRWQESGGPDVALPSRSGFGTSVVRELIPYELGGTAALLHLREGVRCKLEIPGHWLSSNIPEEQRRLN